MTNNQDARPFTDLKKDAEEFRAKFDEDINECISFLDEKITALICDPDSLGNQARCVKQNTLVEFSKAKYDIFISVKTLINRKEREWLSYMSEMRKLFIENVEIFLAGTKLEVKLPSSEYSSLSPKKSPGNQKSISSATSSIYPIINTITKNIPVFSSPLRRQEVASSVSEEFHNVEDKTQFSRRGRLSASSAKLTDSSSASTAFYEKANLESSDISDDEDRRGNKAIDVGVGLDFNASWSGSSSFTKTRRSSNSVTLQKGNNSSDDKKDVEAADMLTNKVPLKTRKGRQARETIKSLVTLQNGNNSSDDKEEVEAADMLSNNIPLKTRKGRQVRKTINSLVNHQKSSSNSENEAAVILSNQMSLKTRKGRQAKETNNSGVILQKTNSSSDENESKTVNQVPLKGRKGRQATKKGNSPAVIQKSTISSDENEVKAEIPNNKVPLRGRRGRQAAKNGANSTTVLPPDNQTTEVTDYINGEEPMEEVLNVKTRRTKSAILKNTKTVSGKNVIGKASTRGQRAAKSVIDEVYEAGTSKSPIVMPLSAGGDSSDELDIETPVARRGKSAVRRKTLLPNLEMSVADIIPGDPTHSRSKRKTIGGVSELKSGAPSKRLKVGSQKNVSSQEDSAASDNLLESDENYSEWMALKAVDGKIPTCPAVYEVKVWRAKKPAYIGSAESLRQRLTLYRLRQNSGHKHLDKFVDRNYNDIQVRYEIMSSINDAKEEVKKRVKSFVEQHKNTPAFN